MDYNINEFHNRLLEIMKQVHKLCVDNNIQYTLIGGSLIGAIRHGGFIPWDDDMDVGMTWENYTKFLLVIKNYRHEWLEFDYPNSRRDYYQAFIKAYDSRTTFVEEQHSLKQARGIFIDIMPFSNAGSTFRQACWNFKFHKFLLAFYRRKGYDLGKSRIKEYSFGLVGKLFSNRFWNFLISKHYEYLNAKKSVFVSDMDGSIKGIVKTGLFQNYKLVKFEDCSLMIICGYDEYLSQVFGNYMQLPPLEAQIPHHITYLNLAESYKEYVKRLSNNL